MSLRKKAEFLVDEIDGLTLDDVDEIYEEWAKMDFDRSGLGHDQALNSLWCMAYEKSLKRLGLYEDYEKMMQEKVQQKEI